MNPPSIPDHELIRPIGRGSYGEVWLARNVMGALRAVKVVHRDRFESDRPFEREFAGIQRYEPVSRSADGLVQILHVGRHADSRCFYYVMELADDANGDTGRIVPGGAFPAPLSDGYAPRTLRLELDRQSRLPVADCVEVGLSLAAGLGHLHRHGLVHRDIKPSNIIFVGGRAKLADLGLVGLASDTRTFVGTEGFIPPEGPGRPGADVYALGKVLYEAATGLDRDLFPEWPDDWISRETPDDALEFFEIILKAGEGDAARRYPSAAALHADLALLESGQSVRRVRTLERRLRRLRRAAAAGGLAVAAAAALAVFAGYRARWERANFQRSEQLRLRAVSAEKRAKNQLFASLLARAEAGQTGRTPDSRASALRAVRSAAEIDPSSGALRNAAASLLALAELTAVRKIEAPQGPEPRIALRRGADAYARLEADGRLRIRALKDDTLHTALDPAAAPLAGGVGFSADGRWLTARTHSGDFEFWDALTGRRCSYRIASAAFVDFDFLAGHDEIIVAETNGRLQRLSLPEGRPVRAFTPARPVASVDASPDGARLATVQGAELSVTDADGGALRGSWSLGSSGARAAVRWAPDGRRLVFLGGDFAAAVIQVDPPSPDPLWLSGHSAEVASAAFSPDGAWIATASWDSTTRVWDPRSGRCVLVQDSWGEVEWGAGDRLTRLRREIDQPQTLEVFQFAPSAVCRILAETPPGRQRSANKGPWAAEFLADGRILAVPSFDAVHFWDAETGGELASGMTDHGASLCETVHPTGLVIPSHGTLVRWPFAWDSAAGELKIGPSTVVEPSSGTFSAAACLGGRRIYAAVGGQVIAREQDRRWEVCSASGPFPRPVPSPDGRSLVVVVRDFVPQRLRNGETGEVIRELADSRLGQVAFSPDSRRIAVVCGGCLRVEEIESGRTLWQAIQPQSSAFQGTARFSPDGRLLAATRSQNLTGLFDAGSGRLIVELGLPDADPISGYAFTPDGSRLAVLCPTHVVQLWDLRRLQAEQANLGVESGLPDFPAQPAPSLNPVRVRFEPPQK